MLDFAVFNVTQDKEGHIQYTCRRKEDPSVLISKRDKNFKPYFYVNKETYEQRKALLDSRVVKIEECTLSPLGQPDQEVFKLICDRSKSVPDIRDIFGRENTWESDVVFTRRWFIDNFYDSEFPDIPPRIEFIDIEVLLKGQRSIPDFENPVLPIIAITVYDNYSKRFLTFAFKEGKRIIDEGKGLFVFPSENEMLNAWIEWHSDNFPDIITGWNVQFDLRYIGARVIKIFGRVRANKKLSPFGFVGFRDEFATFKSFKTYAKNFMIKGITIIDYLNLFKRMHQQKSESYKLDYIAEVTLGKTKIEYKGTLDDLYHNDFTTFLKYNRWDVQLIKDLEEKLGFLSSIFMISRQSKTMLEDHDFSSIIIDSYLLAEAKKQNLLLPTSKKDQSATIPGGRVQKIQKGFHEWIVSFDLDALYPNIIRTINISPEMKIGSEDQAEGMEYAKAGNDVCFRTDKEGFIPAALTKNVIVRERVRAKSRELQKQGKDKEATSLDFLQQSLKIINNATYGYLLFKSSRFFDPEMGAAVTMTGQKIAAHITDNLDTWLHGKYIIASDTDSCYIAVGKYLSDKSKNFSGLPDAKKKIFVEKMSLRIGEHINKVLIPSALDMFHVDKHFWHIKREIIAQSGIFLAKKRYVMWIVDDEGKKVDKLKKVGLELVRSNMSREIKKHLEVIIWDILKGKPSKDCNQKVKRMLKNFRELPLAQVAIPIELSKDVENYGKSKKKDAKHAPGVPVHVVGARWYNSEIVEEDPLLTLKSNTKIRYLYIKKKYSHLVSKKSIHVIAFPDENELPVDEELVRKIIDWEKMEERMVYGPLEPIYEAMDWPMPGQRKPMNVFEIFA